MSIPIVSRADYQRHAETRLREAEVLLQAGRWDGAYYLAGYSVELALKACIIKRLMSRDEFPARKFTENCYTHALHPLAELAGVLPELELDIQSNPALRGFWSIAKDWSEQKRYHSVSEAEARSLVEAITEPAEGVLQWIKARW